MQAHRIIINEPNSFAIQYNLPQELRGVPLEVIVLPLHEKNKHEEKLFNEIRELSMFNNSQNIIIDKSVDISKLASEINS